MNGLLAFYCLRFESLFSLKYINLIERKNIFLMSAAEAKIDLIEKIVQLENPSLIEEIKRLIDFDSDGAEFKLSSEQRNRVEEAREEYKSGNILSETEANNEIEEWLKK